MRIDRLLRTAGLTATLVVPVFAAPASAQGGMSSKSKMPAAQSTMTKSTMDKSAPAPIAQTFLTKAALTNLFEVKAGAIARNKTMDREIDRYARMIINDHKQLQTTLKLKLTAMNTLKAPGNLDQPHLKLIHQLQSASGSAFLKTFKAQQVKGHKEGIALFRSYAQHGDNADLKKWAKSSVSVLEKHLRYAQELPTTMPASTVGSGGQMDEGMSK